MSFRSVPLGAMRRGCSTSNHRWVGRLVALTAMLLPAVALRRCRRGVAALEFAMAATPLIILVFGFFAINLMFYTLTTMQNASFFAVTMLAAGRATTANTGTPVSCAATPASPTAEFFACSDPSLPGWATFQVSSTQDCAGLKVSVTVSVNASSAALVDIFSTFTGETLTTTSVAMKQGSCS